MESEIETAKPVETQIAEWSATDAGLHAKSQTSSLHWPDTTNSAPGDSALFRRML